MVFGSLVERMRFVKSIEVPGGVTEATELMKLLNVSEDALRVAIGISN